MRKECRQESRRSGIRTHDPFHPKEVRYQAALYAVVLSIREVIIRNSMNYYNIFFESLPFLMLSRKRLVAASPSLAAGYQHFHC